MRPRDFALHLEDDPSLPLFRRVAKALEAAIRQGRLKPGGALPGTRVLSEQLGIHRRTVQAALEELEAEGWLVTEPNRGTFVADPLPVTSPFLTPGAPSNPTQMAGFDLPSRLSPISVLGPEELNLADGLPDASLFPTEALGKAYRRALDRHGDRLMQDGEPAGNALLRSTLAAWLSTNRGLIVTPDQILITRGNRAGLTLLSMALLKDGDHVGVEDPGNRMVWETFRHCAQVTLEPLPVDEEGLVVEALEACLKTTKLRLLYVTPRHQFPTTVPLSPGRRAQLLAVAARHRLAILEDDPDADYHYDGKPLLPLASQDPAQVIYLGSLSRILAPGLRLGFLVAPATLVSRLARLQRDLDWQGDRAMEWAVADLIRDEDLTRHLRRARRIYQERRDHLVGELLGRLGTHLDLTAPPSGLALWVRPKPGVDLQAWSLGCRAQHLLLNPPSQFSLVSPPSGVRMGFAQVDEALLTRAVHRLDQAKVAP